MVQNQVEKRKGYICHDTITTAGRFCTTYAVPQERNAFYFALYSLNAVLFPPFRRENDPFLLLPHPLNTMSQPGSAASVSCLCHTTAPQSKPFLLAEVLGQRGAAELLLKSYHLGGQKVPEGVKICMPDSVMICPPSQARKQLRPCCCEPIRDLRVPRQFYPPFPPRGVCGTARRDECFVRQPE